MSKKLTLPHSEEKMAKQRGIVDSLKDSWEAALDTLDSMRLANREAERAEEVRKARVMTPTMRKALEQMTQGDYILVLGNGDTRIGKNTWISAIDKRLVRRLKLAAYICQSVIQGRHRRYIITDAGRAALKAKKAKGQ